MGISLKSAAIERAQVDFYLQSKHRGCAIQAQQKLTADIARHAHYRARHVLPCYLEMRFVGGGGHLRVDPERARACGQNNARAWSSSDPRYDSVMNTRRTAKHQLPQ